MTLARAALAALLVGLGALPAAAASAPQRIDGGRLGSVLRYSPPSAPRAFVFLFSGAEGSSPALQRVAERLAAEGAGVLLVDLPSYLRGLAASADGCHYVVSELEDLSKREQRDLGATGYASPILAGVGAGATLAYAALAQSPAATLRGALVVAPAPALATRVKLCEGAPATPAKPAGFAYAPPRQPLPGALEILLAARTPEPERWKAIAAAAPDAPVGDVVDPIAGLESALQTWVKPGAAPADSGVLARLPVTVIPAAEPGPLFAVIYSGDGGWRDLDKTIGEYLAARGVRVIGIDSLRYFWQARTPEEVARDLGDILRAERERPGGARQAILVGYSFGASILPFAFNRLEAADRASVVQLSLLGLGSRAVFEFHLTGWLQRADETGLLVMPELKQIDPKRIQCFYGADEPDTLCPRPELRAAEVIGTTGGHHFDGDYAKLGQRILDGALRRSGQRATTPVMPPEISAATSVSTKGTESPLGAAR